VGILAKLNLTGLGILPRFHRTSAASKLTASI